MSGARVLVTVLVLAGVGIGVAILAAGGGTSGQAAVAPPAEFPQNAEACGQCHKTIYAEWKETWHAQAYTDPFVFDQTKGWTNSACLPCHVPVPIHGTGVGERTLPREDRRPDGVDCLSCHYKPHEKGVAAPHADAGDGPCNPIHTPEHATVKLCASCHNQHWTVDEWDASPYSQGENPRTCLDCHMPVVREPVVEGGPVRRRRKHIWPGGHSHSQLRRAVTFVVKVEQGEVILETTNSGAGHKIPTDARHRSFNVFLWQYDDAGNLVDGPTELAEYRLYYRADTARRTSTQIAPKDSVEARRPVPAGLTKGKAVGRIYYCLTPDITEKLRQEIRTGRDVSQAVLVSEAATAIAR